MAESLQAGPRGGSLPGWRPRGQNSAQGRLGQGGKGTKPSLQLQVQRGKGEESSPEPDIMRHLPWGGQWPPDKGQSVHVLSTASHQSSCGPNASLDPMRAQASHCCPTGHRVFPERTTDPLSQKAADLRPAL